MAKFRRGYKKRGPGAALQSETMDAQLSASLEPAYLNNAVGPAAGARDREGCGRFILGVMVSLLVLCLTTTTALVAVHHVQAREMAAKLDYLIGRVPDIPSLMSNLHGDVEGVQELVSGQTTQMMLAYEMQGARVEQLATGLVRLVEVLQDYFGQSGG